MGHNTPRYSKLIFHSFWKALIKRITVWSCWKLHLLTYWPLTNFIFFLMNTDLLVTLGTMLTLYMIVVWRQKQLYFFFALLLLSFYLTQLFNELCETDRNLPPYTKFLWWEVFEYHSSYMEALFLVIVLNSLIKYITDANCFSESVLYNLVFFNNVGNIEYCILSVVQIRLRRHCTKKLLA